MIDISTSTFNYLHLLIAYSLSGDEKDKSIPYKRLWRDAECQSKAKGLHRVQY